MMTGQDRTAQVVEAGRTVFAAIALPVRLGVIPTMSGHGRAAAGWTPDAIRPAVLPNQIEAFRVIDQRSQGHQGGVGHEQP